jgi:hypothetical protein
MQAEHDIDRQLETLHQALATSRAALQEGESVDLKGLDSEVGRVCALIAALDRQEGVRYVPELKNLVATLDKLATDLRIAFERPL